MQAMLIKYNGSERSRRKRRVRKKGRRNRIHCPKQDGCDFRCSEQGGGGAGKSGGFLKKAVWKLRPETQQQQQREEAPVRESAAHWRAAPREDVQSTETRPRHCRKEASGVT